MSERNDIEPRDWIPSFVLALTLLICDYVLKLASRLGGCSPPLPLKSDWFGSAWIIPEQCEGTQLVGTALVLLPQFRVSGPFGLFSPLSPIHGQFLALAGFAFATAVSIFIVRWRWQSSGDTQLMACLWTGVALDAVPRLLGKGQGLAEMIIFGLPLGIADLMIAWSIIWLIWRIASEIAA